MTLRIERIRTKDGKKIVRVNENQTEKNLSAHIEIYERFFTKDFRAMAIYNNDTNECLYKHGRI